MITLIYSNEITFLYLINTLNAKLIRLKNKTIKQLTETANLFNLTVFTYVYKTIRISTTSFKMECVIINV